MSSSPRQLLAKRPTAPRFVIFSSYGNDSVALIQWAKENQLRDVTVVFSDTKWAAKSWMSRVEAMEWWVHRTPGFDTDRTTSMGFVELARMKKAFPVQQFQWCSYYLKIEPGERWLRENDPDGRAICLVGVRHEESEDRKGFPEYLLNSGNHGDRAMIAPLARYTEEMRDALLTRAGVRPLPHRSMECAPCVNSNRADIKALTEEDVVQVETLETEMDREFGLTRNGKRRTLFRPHRHMGAVGIREIKAWAESPRGKFRGSAYGKAEVAEDLPREADEFTCNNGYCVT